MSRQFFWIKETEQEGWIPAMRDRYDHFWPIGHDGWLSEKDCIEIGPEIKVPVNGRVTKLSAVNGSASAPVVSPDQDAIWQGMAEKGWTPILNPNLTFEAAFITARKLKAKEFVWQSRKYTTNRADEEVKALLVPVVGWHRE